MTTLEELRSLVAEKVMGWESDIIPDGVSAWSWKPGRLHIHKMYEEKARWDPLESWADAGRVIDRMFELDWQLEFHSWPSGHTTARFVKWPTKGDPYEREGVGIADSPKAAISLAALRALGVEAE